MKKKVALIGAGNVGGEIANQLAEKDLASIVLLDKVEGIARGKALDIKTSLALKGSDSEIIGTINYSDIDSADVVVITAGIPRKPGMTREELVAINAKIISEISEKIKIHAPDAIVILVTNPLDVMTYLAIKKTGFDPNKVFGMAGVLDTARYRIFIAMELGVSVDNVQAMVLGGHGDEMVPLVDYTTVSGISIKHFLDSETINKLIFRTRNGGAEIVKLLETSAYYAPASSVIQMVNAILKDKNCVLPASVLLKGQYGINDACAGVPVILGSQGIKKIIELELNPEDLKQLNASATLIKETMQKLDKI